MMEENKNLEKTNWNVAIVLAGGRGSRMNSNIPKQYIEVKGKPILYYSLKTFEESFIDEIILVVGEDEIHHCKTNIVNKYAFNKVSKVVAGGRERYNSVYNGIKAISFINMDSVNVNIFIHDGARPCLTINILENCLETVKLTNACITAVAVKDTIKVVDGDGYTISTPDRRTLWQIQTPQVFSYGVIKQAYDDLFDLDSIDVITDDAMVVERFSNTPVKIVQGSYDNIKVTTESDIKIVEVYFDKINNQSFV